MMAREPQDRYQTASELIVDLERSRLAARVPGYADPDQALQDPWVRAQLASQGQPTSPDLDARRPTPVNDPPARRDAANDEFWLLRYRNKSGRINKARLRTQEVIERVCAGRLPVDVEARHLPHGPFLPLRAFAEFKDVAKPASARGDGKRDIRARVIGGAIAAAVAGALLGYLLLR
jgi:hypothetical protein